MEHLDRDTLKEKILEQQRAVGCTCKPDISFTISDDRNPTTGDRIMDVKVEHDANCPSMSLN